MIMMFIKYLFPFLLNRTPSTVREIITFIQNIINTKSIILQVDSAAVRVA
jgi:hypothetical protein